MELFHTPHLILKRNVYFVTLTKHLNEPCSSHELYPLSSREREVLQLIAEGKSTKEIAFTLDIKGKTIESHRRQIMQKLKLSNIADLTRYAIREGISSL
jgi:DNA-binding NarL/FixJ family response regulator